MPVTIAHRVPLAVAATALALVAARPAQQSPADLPLAQTAILRTYAKGPDGLDLYQVRDVVIEPRSGALWITFGEESEPPIRIDRKTNAIRTIGRKGAGPDEYTRIIAMVPGARGDVGIWDPARRLWFWVDSAGRQTRTWSIPTNSLVYGGVYSDTRGAVYLKQRATYTPGDFNNMVIVRLDSASGFRDSTPILLKDDGRWSWSGTSASGAAGGTRVSGAPSVLSGVDARGRMFAAWSDSNFVLVKDAARVTRLVLPDYQEPLTAEERSRATTSLDQFEAGMKRQSLTPKGPRPPIPTLRSQIRTITPEMNGGLAIVRSRPCASVPTWRAPGTGAPASDPNQRCAFLERFDADGHRLRPLSLLYGDFVQVVRGDTVWTTRETRDQLVHIVELVVAK
jgi:hypothetical protein